MPGEFNNYVYVAKWNLTLSLKSVERPRKSWREKKIRIRIKDIAVGDTFLDKIINVMHIAEKILVDEAISSLLRV